MQPKNEWRDSAFPFNLPNVREWDIVSSLRAPCPSGLNYDERFDFERHSAPGFTSRAIHAMRSRVARRFGCCMNSILTPTCRAGAHLIACSFCSVRADRNVCATP